MDVYLPVPAHSLFNVATTIVFVDGVGVVDIFFGVGFQFSTTFSHFFLGYLSLLSYWGLLYTTYFHKAKQLMDGKNVRRFRINRTSN